MIVIGAARGTRRRPRAWSLALLGLGLWTLALSPIVAAQHRATHGHVTCEHGSEIEVGHVSAAPASPPLADRSIDQGAGSPGTEDHHHHCFLGGAATITVAARPMVAATTVDVPIAIARAPLPVARSVDVLVDAPKTSPPV